MNVSFAITDIAVSEGEGVVTLMLEKSEGAVGPVSVRIFTTAGTALGTSKTITPLIMIPSQLTNDSLHNVKSFPECPFT